MTNEILKRIDLLAAKLGIAAEKLWEVLVAQARIDAIQSLIWAGVWIVLAGVMCYAFKQVMEWAAKDDDWTPLMIGCGVAILILSVSAIALIVSSITPFFNPQYWAFQELMKQIGK